MPETESQLHTGTGTGGKRRLVCVSPVHVWAAEPGRVEPGRRRAAARRLEWAARRARAGSFFITSEAADRVSISAAVTGGVAAAGPLLAEVQGQSDLTLAEDFAARLAAAASKQGRERPSHTTLEDAAAACVLAITFWRSRLGPFGGDDRDRRLVCWRAVVAEVSRDTLGDSVELSSLSPELLAGSALPLPPLLGDESRTDRAARLLFERARAKRPALLDRRLESLKAAGGRGRRAESIDRVGRAARLLLQGESLGAAATLAGFKSAGVAGHVVRAEDYLVRAARRLGFRFLFTLREREQRKASGHHGAFNPMTAATAARLAAVPSATLPLHPGGNRRHGRLALLARHYRKQQAARARAARRAARLARQGKAAARAAAIARRAAARLAKSGLWAGGPLSGNNPRYVRASLGRGERRQWHGKRLIVG